MKTVSAGLLAHQTSGSTTIAQCWHIIRRDGREFGFTSTDIDLVVDGMIYLAATGFTPSAIASSADLAVDNLEVAGLLDSPTITEADIEAGLWDDAYVEIFEVNYRNLSQGRMILRTGRTGEIKTGRATFVTEMRGLTQLLQQSIGELFTQGCQADLGDDRCKVDLTPWTVTGEVTGLGDGRTFADTDRVEPDGYFDGGKVTWLTGLNTGLSMEVKENFDGIITLQLPMPYAIAGGDTYSMHAGCKKRRGADCRDKFSNVINFRGFPDIPGTDRMVGGI